MATKIKKKIKMLDLFAGCGGLTDGFMQTRCFTDVAAVEWKEPQVSTLRHRLSTKWGKRDAEESILHFDIQREEELFCGWSDDAVFGTSKGLDYYVDKANGIDIIIGGPPCQAYSVAGRVRDENGNSTSENIVVTRMNAFDVFVMGDNRYHSADSRDSRIGLVDTRRILGKVIFRISPFSRFGTVD